MLSGTPELIGILLFKTPNKNASCENDLQGEKGFACTSDKQIVMQTNQL